MTRQPVLDAGTLSAVIDVAPTPLWVIGPDGTIQLIEIGFSGKSHTEKAINEAIDKARSGKVANAA